MVTLSQPRPLSKYNFLKPLLHVFADCDLRDLRDATDEQKEEREEETQETPPPKSVSRAAVCLRCDTRSDHK